MNKLSAFIPILGILITLSGCGTPQDQTKASHPVQQHVELPSVDAFVLKDEDFKKEVRLPGELKPYEEVDVYPKVEGFIQNIYVDRASIVHRGQLLATLIAPEMQARIAEAGATVEQTTSQIAEAKARYLSDKGVYERYREAAKTPGVISLNELETAKMTAAASMARVQSFGKETNAKRQNVRSLQQMEAYLQVTAPFDGVVVERDLHPGALAGPSGAGATSPIVKIQELKRLRLDVAVPERYYSSVKLGMTIPFTVPAYPDRLFHGILRRPAYAVDMKNRTELVEMDVENTMLTLASGMFAQTRWPVFRPDKTFVVPVSAIVSTTEKLFVERIEPDGAIEWVNIKRGYADGDQTEVFGDLHDGDHIVLNGTDEIRPQSQVRIHTVSATDQSH